MRRHYLIGWPLLTMGAVVLFTWVRPGEPRFDGKALSSWLEQADPRNGYALPAEAMAAIAGMGSNPVPYLVRMLETTDSPFKKRVAKFFEERNWGEPPFQLAYARRYTAACAFEAIGPDGAGAIPKLQALLEDEERGSCVAHALGGIGAAAIPALTNGLAATNRQVRRAVVFELGRLEAKASPAIPALVQALADVDDRVAAQAAASLGQIRDRPGEILPVLSNCLLDPRTKVRTSALWSIGNFEEEARSTLPQVLELMGDPAQCVRNEALRTVRKIDREPIKLLISQLQNPNARVRQTAVYGLGLDARCDTNAFNALSSLLADEDEAVREQAAKALKSIDRVRGSRMKVP